MALPNIISRIFPDGGFGEKIKDSIIPYGTEAPKVAGTAAVGTSTVPARADHVHPVQTSVSGNAGTATALATACNISLSGDVTGTASFNGTADALITTTLKNATVLQSMSRAAVVAANVDYTVPSYIVGSGRLQVYLDGILCAGGSDATMYAYVEVGSAGAASTSIKFHQAIPVDMEIIARVQ